MDSSDLFFLFGAASVLIFIVGLYSIVASRDLIRAVIGVEILAKAVTLLIITVGYCANRMALAQAFVITIIVIEVAVTAVAVGIVLCLFRHEKSIDVEIMRNLKG